MGHSEENRKRNLFLAIDKKKYGKLVVHYSMEILNKSHTHRKLWTK